MNFPSMMKQTTAEKDTPNGGHENVVVGEREGIGWGGLVQR